MQTSEIFDHYRTTLGNSDVEVPGVEVAIFEGGSDMYGTGQGGDIDLIGVRFETWEELTTRNVDKSISIRSAPGATSSLPGDVDIVVHTVRKFLHLALKGNPTLLACLWAPAWERFPVFDIHDLRERAWNNTAIQAFKGYSYQQMQRMQGVIGQRGVTRNDLIKKYGWDTKYGYHALRLAIQGLDFGKTGNIFIPLPAKDRELLNMVRNGAITESECVEMIEETLQEYGKIDVPPYDSDKARQIIGDTYYDYWLGA